MDNLRQSRAFQGVLTIAGFVVVVFWSSFAGHRLALQTFDRAKTQQKYGYLLNGTRMSLDHHVTVVQQGGPWPAAHSSGTRKLVLISSDSCAASRKHVPRWDEFLRLVPSGAISEVVVVSDGHEIPALLIDALRASRAAYRIVKPTRMEALMIETGIQSTPFTIALDGDNRARLIARTLGTEQTAIFLSFFASGNQTPSTERSNP